MDEQPFRLYAADAVRGFDRYAIENAGIPGAELMRRAAAALWRRAAARWPDAAAGKVAVLCGAGNNGGDGYEIARLARAAGSGVTLWQFGVPAGGDAQAARAAWLADGGSMADWPAQGADLGGSTLIVDAMFGTGLTRPVPSSVAQAVAAVAVARAGGSRVVAVDIPSGVAADSGAVLGAAVRADLTVTFIGNKLGLYLGAGPEYAGSIEFDDLAIPPQTYQRAPPALRVLAPQDLAGWLPPRPRESHKGSNGHVLLIGGAAGTAGAILLAARGALRAGAGLVSVATRPEHAATLAAAQPEIMFAGAESAAALTPLLERADIVAIGPGLGVSAWGRELWEAVRGHPALVVDADALNLLAQQPAHNPTWILTPHPGEAARLLGVSTVEVQADRLGALHRLAQRYGGVAVLKGAGTLVADTPPWLCTAGNPGMGTGGMGDVLCGIVAGLRAQRLPASTAAAAAVLGHALAGDRAARGGQRGLIPEDLLAQLRCVLNPECAVQ